MIKRLFKQVLIRREEQRRSELYRNLIRHEARLGGELFGPIPENHRREFFCLDNRTWVWHEEWTDQKGVNHVKTTRYDVRPDGILKAQDGRPYQRATKDEVLNLYNATQLYKTEVLDKIYNPA
jgi:hypothetical protein